MLFKFSKNINDLLQGKPHEPNKEISRRDFLQKSAYAGGIYLSIPTFFSLLRTDKALAAALSQAYREQPCSFAAMMLQGGNGFSRMVHPQKMDGGVITNKALLGLMPGDAPNSTLIPGIHLNQSDQFFKVLMAGGAYTNLPQFNDVKNGDTVVGVSLGSSVSATALMTSARAQALLSKVTGAAIYSRKNDDTDANPLNPIKLVQQMRLGQLAKTVGNSNRGTRNWDGSRLFETVQAGSVAGFVQSANLASGPVGDSTANGASIEKAVRGLANEQKPKYSGRVGAADLFNSLVNGLSETKGKFDPGLADLAYNPDNAANSAVLSPVINYASLSASEKSLLAAYDANARQIAGSAYTQHGGYDYHNNRHDDMDVRHSELARRVLIWAAAQDARKKPGVLFITTDGAISFTDKVTASNPVGDTGPSARGDGGDRGMALVLYYNPVARTAIHQVGYFQENAEAVSTAHLVASRKEVGYEPVSAALTFGRLSGLVTPGDASIQEFINLVNSKGTLISGGESQLLRLSSRD
jgi:hypothetical protein